MIKLFFTDLDGTFFYPSIHVSQENLNAVQKLFDREVFFGIATGRTDKEVVELSKHINLEHVYRVSANGATVRSKKGNLISKYLIPYPIGRDLFAILNQNGVAVLYKNDDEVFCQSRDKTLRQERVNDQHILDINYVQNLAPIILKNHDNITSFVVTPEDPTQNDAFIKIMEAFQKSPLLVANITAIQTSKYSYDFMNIKASKGNGILDIARTLGIAPDEIAVIGDSYNDLSMFEITPHSYVMDHADDTVQKKAAHVVSSVAEAIEHALQIP